MYPATVLGIGFLIMVGDNIALLHTNTELDSRVSEVIAESRKLADAKQNLCNSQRTQYFSAGYIYGFRGAVKAAGLPGIGPSLDPADIEARKFASEHGFTAADKYGDD